MANDKALAASEREQSQAARQRASKAEGRATSLQAELDALRRDNEKLTAQLQSTRSQLDERSRAASSDTDQRLRGREQELSGARGELERTGTRLRECDARNVALLSLGSEIIGRFEQRTLGERVSGGDPFFRLGRVQLENLAEGYRDRLFEQMPTSSNP